MSLISADDSWMLWAVIATGTALSIWLEGRYRWAAKLSAPVVGLLIAMALSNSQVMPAAAPAYDFITDWLVPLALPLLLMRANVVLIARETGRLFVAFHISAMGTAVGAFAAVAMFRGNIAGSEKAAAIMTGSYSGGMVNFAAISAATSPEATLQSALIVADNFVMAGIFVMVLSLAGSRWMLARYRHPHTASDGAGLPAAENLDDKPEPMTAGGLAAALAVAFGVVALALAAGRVTGSWLPAEIRPGSFMDLVRVLLTNRFVLITAMSLLAATVFHRSLVKLHRYEEVGRYLLYVFLFSIGLPADLRAVLVNSPLLFVFCAVMALTNAAVTLLAGRLLKLNLEDCLISINATIGGPASAVAMAVSRGWPRLVLPGLLAGLWGYVIGTPLGMMVYVMLSRN